MPTSLCEKRGRHSSHTAKLSAGNSYGSLPRPESNKMELLDIASDAMFHVATFLDCKDLSVLAATCSTLRQIVDSNNVWMNLCNRWAAEVPLKEWLPKVHSAKALYRMLRAMDRVVGLWSAQDLIPRGGLLYVAWGDLSVVAYRIMPEWPAAQSLVSMRLFEVIGHPDGSTHVQLVTREGKPLQGALVWQSDSHSEFHLENESPPKRAALPPSPDSQAATEGRAHSPDEAAEQAVLQAHQRQRRLREQLYQQQLVRNLWLGDDRQHQGMPLPEPPHGEFRIPNRSGRPNQGAVLRDGTPNQSSVGIVNGNRNENGNVNGNGNGNGSRTENGNGNESGNGSGHGTRTGHGPQLVEGGDQELRSRALQYLGRLAMRDRHDHHRQDVPTPAGSAGAADGSHADAAAQRQTNRTPVAGSRYQKLKLAVPSEGRELAGLWSGVYGPHGLEILNVDYTADGMIVATKILGDPNVPSGEVTFRASLDSENMDRPPEAHLLASMLVGHGDSEASDLPTVVKTYKGEGRVANFNFRHPKWVPGQLLVEQSGRFAFLWKDVNFIIRFRPLKLADLVPWQAVASQG